MALRFRPESKDIVADVMTLFHEGEYHIFYLHSPDRDLNWPRWKTDWGHIKSTDLIHWEELPDALYVGEQRLPDGGACFTGSAIIKDGICHLFYTGYHPGHKNGREQIMHASSSDMLHFEKDPSNPVLLPDHVKYTSHDNWRDPFVFWNEEEQLYWMTVTATSKTSGLAPSRTGVTALCKSADLLEWTICDPIYEPRNCPALECSEVFQMGNWWYLLFSTFDGRTQYRMAKSPSGPWICPKQPCFDLSDTFFYAAKTVFDGKRRLIFGWCGTLFRDQDSCHAQWGGDMVSAREVYALPDGELAVRCPEEYVNGYQKQDISVRPAIGNWSERDGRITAFDESGFSAAILKDTSLDGIFRVSFNALSGKGKIGFGFHCSDGLEACYLAVLDVAQNLFEIYRFRDTAITDPLLLTGQLGGMKLPIASHAFGCETVNELLVLKQENVIELFLNSKYSFTVRVNEISSGNFALITEDTQGEFSAVSYCR